MSMGSSARVLSRRMESALVIETVCPALLEKVPVLPLHDCLYARLCSILALWSRSLTRRSRCGVSLGLKEGRAGRVE